MTITPEKNKSLKALNTFGFDQQAELFVRVHSEQEIEQAVRYAQVNGLSIFILGGGSNLVLVNDIAGLVIQLADQSVNIEQCSANVSNVTASAGVNWHSLVMQTLQADVPGLENLSLIPGSVGAAPVQNIGAYGVEVRERIVEVKALHIPTLQWHTLKNDQCNFSYRHSYFKDKPDDYIISQVQFSLGQQHSLQFAYATLQKHLQSRNISNPTARQISESVVAIRSSRLPDPATLGNAGSFFHNPIVDADTQLRLKTMHPGLVSYAQADGNFKLAAGWLIDNLGFKGATRKGVGVHNKQALVLINQGSGTGTQLLALANEIMSAVLEHYGVQLHIEPRVIP